MIKKRKKLPKLANLLYPVQFAHLQLDPGLCAALARGEELVFAIDLGAFGVRDTESKAALQVEGTICDHNDRVVAVRVSLPVPRPKKGKR